MIKMAERTYFVKLDAKDKKILSELDWNARIPNSEIAKRVSLSKKGVEYKIKRMEKEQVILGYYPVVNFEKLGFRINRMMFGLQFMGEETKKKIEEYLSSQEDIHWAIWCRGDFDLGIDVWSKSLKEFKSSINKFLSKFGKNIKRRVFSTSAGFDQYPSSFLTGKRDERFARITEEQQTEEIDDLDKKILKQLAKNARQNSAEIARNINSNYKTVSNRIKSMEDSGIILCTRAMINTEIIGYKWYKLRLRFDRNIDEAIKKAEDYFRRRIETAYIVDYVGEEDFDVELIVKEEAVLFKIIEDIQNHLKNPIRSYSYFSFEKNIKIRYLPNF